MIDTNCLSLFINKYDDLLLWSKLRDSNCLSEDFATYYNVNKYVDFLQQLFRHRKLQQSSHRGIMSYRVWDSVRGDYVRDYVRIPIKRYQLSFLLVTIK